MNDRGKLDTYLMSPLSTITNPENSSQFKLVKDHNSKRVNDLIIKNEIPITFYNSLFTFRDTDNEFERKRDLLKIITTNNYNFDHASLADKKTMYDFAKEMHFDLRAVGKKSNRDRTLIKLLKSQAIMASGVPNTISLSSDPDELRERLKLLLQEKQAGNISDIISKEIAAIVDKKLE